jgi:hypothetical protein
MKMLLAIKIAAALVGALVGTNLAYYPAAYYACYVFWPQSNLCGVPAVFIAMPIGLIAGAIAGWLIARRLIRLRGTS